jgi:hypothetical protein
VTLSNKTYDTLKWVAQILLPALGALYFALSDLWSLPKVVEVVGTIAAVDTFLGVLLGITAAGYKKQNDPNGGYIQQVGVDPHTGMPDLALTLSKLPNELMEKKSITLHVEKPPPMPVFNVETAAAAPVVPEDGDPHRP